MTDQGAKLLERRVEYIVGEGIGQTSLFGFLDAMWTGRIRVPLRS